MALADETKTLLETMGCAVDGGDLAVHSPLMLVASGRWRPLQ